MNLFRRDLASWEHVIIARGWVSYYSFLLVLNVDVRLFEIEFSAIFPRYRCRRNGGRNHTYLRFLQKEQVVQRQEKGAYLSNKGEKSAKTTYSSYDALCSTEL